MDSWIFTQRCDGLQVLGTNLWKDLFPFYELEEIMRQRDDLEFAQLLNRHLIPEDIDKLKTRITGKKGISLHLLRNCLIYILPVLHQQHNMEVLASVSEAQKTSFDAIDSIPGGISTYLRRKIIDKVPDDP